MENCVHLILNTAIASGAKATAVFYPLLSSLTDLQPMGADSELRDDFSQALIFGLKDVGLKAVPCLEPEVRFVSSR